MFSILLFFTSRSSHLLTKGSEMLYFTLSMCVLVWGRLISDLFFRLRVFTDRHIEDSRGLVCVESCAERPFLGSAQELSEHVQRVRHYGTRHLQTAQILVARPNLRLNVHTACLWTEIIMNTNVGNQSVCVPILSGCMGPPECGCVGIATRCVRLYGPYSPIRTQVLFCKPPVKCILPYMLQSCPQHSTA